MLIYNGNSIIVYNLGDYYLEVPTMTVDYYNHMKKKWNHTNFELKLTGKNDNNIITTNPISLNITINAKKDIGDPSTTYWWIIILISAICIILIIAVKVSYNSIFRKKALRNLQASIN